MATKKDDIQQFIAPLLKHEQFKAQYRLQIIELHNKGLSPELIHQFITMVAAAIEKYALIIHITVRDSLRKYDPNTYKILIQFFGTFSEAKKAVKLLVLKEVDPVKLKGKAKKPVLILRKDIDICKALDTSKHKKLVISCIFPGTDIDEEGLQSINTWCTKNDGELYLLAMRGVSKKDGYDTETLLRFKDSLITELYLNTNLVAKDFQILPQMIIPTTGLKRFGQKNYSVIVASPKQFMASVARGKGKHPHIIYTTGTICRPNYRYDRQGQIAQQDHTYGGLIIELIDDNYFYIRNFTLDEHSGFNDLDKYYCGTSAVEEPAEAVSLGDSHYGMEDDLAEQGSKDLVALTKPKYVVFNDLCDNRSITHHERRKILARHKRSSTQQTLTNELNHLASKMQDWINMYPTGEFVIIPSNHDDFIEEWLNSGEFAFDDSNARIGAELFISMLDGFNPIKWFLEKYHNITQLKFLDRDDSFSIGNCELNAHGDKGANGAKGSVNSLEISYGKCTSAHAHTPQIFRDIYIVGTNSIANPNYTKGSTSSWLAADVVHYKNGSRQMIIKINGKFTSAQQ